MKAFGLVYGGRYKVSNFNIPFWVENKMINNCSDFFREVLHLGLSYFRALKEKQKKY